MKATELCTYILPGVLNSCYICYVLFGGRCTGLYLYNRDFALFVQQKAMLNERACHGKIG